MNEVIEIKEKKDCCGCNACYSICPKQCIEMNDDKEGFKYPKINEEKCIKCNLCVKVCPMLNDIETKIESKFYACINNNEEIRMKSSSGGVFSLLADYVIENDGYIYGVAFDKEFDVKHIEVKDKENLEKLRGSKYVQSSIEDTYKLAKKRLDDGKIVLFSGVQCQIKGLNLFLKKRYENLITIEVICHGAPSPNVFKKYLKKLEVGNNKKIKKVIFRDKTTGWKTYSNKIEFEDSIIRKELGNKNIYMQGFLGEIFLRESCYGCKAKEFKSCADITLGDYWGVEKIHPKIDDNKGVSLVITNTDMGEKCLEKMKDKMYVIETNKEHAINHNICIVKSVKRNKNRDKFFENLDKIDIEKNIEKSIRIQVGKRIYLKGRGILGKIKRKCFK